MKKALQLRGELTDSIFDREKIVHFYTNKYFNLYMNSVKWKGIDYKERDFIMKKLWCLGTFACFKLKESEGSTDYPNGKPIFTPYASSRFNIYDFPIEVNLINTRGVSFIPTTRQKVDKDVVLFYAQRNHKPVFQLVKFYIQKIADVEMVIYMNLKAHKTPVIVGVTPESKKRMEDFMNDIEMDKYKLFMDVEDKNSITALVSGAPYIIDKLYSYKSALENELKEYLGLNNMGLNEKKEHLITSEVESNDEVVEASGECFIDVLKEGCQTTKDVLGMDISVELNLPDRNDNPLQNEEEI